MFLKNTHDEHTKKTNWKNIIDLYPFSHTHPPPPPSSSTPIITFGDQFIPLIQ